MQTRPINAAERLAARWTPAGGQAETLVGLGVVVWRYSVADGRPAACVYKGTSVQPVFNGPFPTLDRREAYIENWKMQLEREEGMRASFREQREMEVQQFFTSLTVGTVFYLTGGWEQTNVQFFEVVGPAKARSVAVRKLNFTTVESAPMAMAGHAEPRRGDFDGEVITWRYKNQIPKIWNEGVRVRISWYG